MTAFNFNTMTEYGGANAGLVGNGTLPAFATFNQLKSMGYMVRKGAKGVKIFCGFVKKDDPKTGKQVSVPKSATVFDIIDTSAADDKDFLKWLAAEVKAGKLKKSAVQAEAEVVAAMGAIL